jgi:YidC/Oxa1 family membrane protein insertase
MEKRTLVALALILLVLYLSNKYIYKPPPVPEQVPEEEIEAVEAVAEEAADSIVEIITEAPLLEEAEDELQTALPGTTVVETDRYRLTFTSRGGAMIGATLMGYEYFPDGSRVRLISSDLSNFLTFALSVKKDTLDLENATFNFDKERLSLSERRPEGKLTLTAIVGRADTIRTEYAFNNNSYLIGVKQSLPRLRRSGEGWKIHAMLGPTLRPTEKDSTKDDFPNIGAVYMKGTEVDDKKMSKFEGGESEYVKGPLPWICMKNKYFIIGFIGRAIPFEGVVMRGDKERNRFEVSSMIQLEPGETEVSYEIFIGPQDYRELKPVGLGMEKMVEYGWWIIKPFTRLILVIMLWMHTFISNYGLVIVLFSVFTKVVFYPLTKKSLQASKDMQKVQPLIKELREKHKEDPKKLQEETMRLYKEQKVNPLGGCLPMLVQMPVLWALFYVFQRTIEFRGEEFIFWIKDLSAPDSPPVLPIVMGLSMYVQQKMTPTTDPRMAPMQFIMPVVLTIIFINFPAGLVLYWTVNNLMSILQQYYMKRDDGQVTKGRGASGKGGKKSEQARQKQ